MANEFTSIPAGIPKTSKSLEMNLEFPTFLANQMPMQLMVWPGHMLRTISKPFRKQYWPEKDWQGGCLAKKERLLIFLYTS